MPRAAKVFYRTAAVLFLLFAAGHTAGFLSFRPASAEGRAVLEGMQRVHFNFGGSSATWTGFYTGFGLFVSAYLLFSTFLAWRLSYATAAEAAMGRTLGGTLFLVQLAIVALCLIYFGFIQAAFASACAVCVGLAALKTQPE